ncbi:MAG: hypothetical protein WD651_02055 [Acidimicrobiia bacterium]
MLDKVRALTSLTASVVLVGAAVIGLHNLSGALPATAVWSSRSGFEEALGAAVRLLGLAAGYWLLGSTAIYLIGRLVRFPMAVAAVNWATLPWVRRVADRVTARTLVRVLATPLPLLELVTPGYVPVPAGDPPSTTTTVAPADSALVIEPPVESSAEPIEVVVKPGDHMWSLAKARLRDSLGRLPTDAEISPYWRRVIEANQARIRSGDADLIFPGEVLILPEL